MNRSELRAKCLLATTCIIFGMVPAMAQSPHTHQHGFADAQQWAKVFDDPARDAWQKPHEVIQALALKPDALVADIGAGTGYFALRFAHMVPRGRVYAVDTEPSMVQHLERRAREAGLKNILAVRGESDDPRLPEKVDLVVLVDVYHHIEERVGYFGRLKQALRAQARIAIIDFRMDSPMGPPVAARVAPERVKAELERAGYALDQTFDFLPHQYFLVFRARGS
jgi:SAM-dependent methyltransferase